MVASWVCRSDNGCGYWLVCAQCYTEHYWGLDPFQRGNYAQHLLDAAAGNRNHGRMSRGESYKGTVRRFARDCLLPQRLYSGDGQPGDRMIFRIATEDEVATGYSARGDGAFNGLHFVRFESLQSRERPVGQPLPEYGDRRFVCISYVYHGQLCVHSWAIYSWTWRNASMHFISENHTLVVEANLISKVKGVLEAGRYLGNIMTPRAFNVCGTVGQVAQEEFFKLARDASLRSLDKLRHYCDSEFLPHVGPDFEGIFGGPKLVHAWGWVVSGLFSGEVSERAVIRGSDADAASDPHEEANGYKQLSGKQAERVCQVLQDAASQGQDPCQWHRPAESTAAMKALGSRSSMSDLRKQLEVCFDCPPQLQWMHSVDVWAHALGLLGLVKGIPHDDPDYDAEMISLIAAVMYQVELERSWKGPGPPPAPPAGLVRRLLRSTPAALPGPSSATASSATATSAAAPLAHLNVNAPRTVCMRV